LTPEKKLRKSMRRFIALKLRSKQPRGGERFMEFMLQLEDTLAEELRQQASDEHTSAEEFAQRLVREALQERSAAKRWRAQNRRRLELIAKKLHGPLTVEEEEELRQLQSVAYERAVPFDQALLQTAADLREQLERLPEEPVL
jgi:hypothetical protein